MKKKLSLVLIIVCFTLNLVSQYNPTNTQMIKKSIGVTNGEDLFGDSLNEKKDLVETVVQSTSETDDVSIVLDLKVFLEGPFFSYQMTPFLNVLGFLPLIQPYNVNPWFYTGTESVPSMPSYNIIDWILVDLIKPITENAEELSIISRTAGFVLNNGKITGLDGFSDLVMQSPDISGFYVRINHRNHISIISSDSLVNNSGIYSWDFTTGPLQVFGEEHSQNQITTGVWGMIAGNGDANDQIDNVDKNEIWLIQQNSFGYYFGDYDMDCQVNDDDIITKWKPNSGKGFNQNNQ